MAKFSKANVESLDYDFTGFPSINGGNCSGKGIIPEPTKAIQNTFWELKNEILGEGTTVDVEAAQKFSQREDAETISIKMFSDLCQDSPSFEELSELPPRIFNEFTTWLLTEIFLPKGLRNDTRS